MTSSAQTPEPTNEQLPSGLVNPRWEVATDGSFVDRHAPTEDQYAAAMEVMGWTPLTFQELRAAADMGGSYEDHESAELVAHIARALAAAVTAEREKVRLVLAAAWDEGYTAGVGDRGQIAWHQQVGNSTDHLQETRNPYIHPREVSR